MAKSKAKAGARPKASRREGRAPAAATAASALRGRSAAPTKQAAVIGLLQREGGATLSDLVDATGWLVVAAFSDAIFDIIEATPERLKEVPGIGPEIST